MRMFHTYVESQVQINHLDHQGEQGGGGGEGRSRTKWPLAKKRSSLGLC